MKHSFIELPPFNISKRQVLLKKASIKTVKHITVNDTKMSFPNYMQFEKLPHSCKCASPVQFQNPNTIHNY